MLSEKTRVEIQKEIAKYPQGKQQSAVIAALALSQAEFGYISKESMADIAEVLSMPVIDVYEVASFYNMFDLTPRGKYKITMCTNLPCMLMGATEAFSHLCKKLGLSDSGGTTEDNQFTVQYGECFGACADSPVVLVNNHEMKIKMNKAAIDELITTLSDNGVAK